MIVLYVWKEVSEKIPEEFKVLFSKELSQGGGGGQSTY